MDVGSALFWSDAGRRPASGLLLDFKPRVDVLGKETDPGVGEVPDLVHVENHITQVDCLLKFWCTPGSCQSAFWVTVVTLTRLVVQRTINVFVDA